MAALAEDTARVASAATSGRVITDISTRARATWRVDDLVPHETEVDGRRASYASGGRGVPVLFLHGWGLDHRSYLRTLRRLTARGCHVIAPSLPGFGMTDELPRGRLTLAGYAEWVRMFLDAIGIDEPVVVLGHSFGGGVATKFAHDHPERARFLVVLNGVGDPRAFSAPGPGALVRPLLDAFKLSSDGIVTTSAMQRSFLANVARHPMSVLKAGQLARTADLTDEMAALAARGLPVLVLWSDHDGIIPLSAFDTFCSTFGTDGHVVRGGHSWLLADPDVFGEVLDNVIHLQNAAHEVTAQTASIGSLRTLLAETTMPRAVSGRLLAGVSPLWVMSESPGVLAADLVLCHPRLGNGEVRAVARAIPRTNRYRLTVVAADRNGLLADTAATLAGEGLSVISASVTTWPSQRLALHAMTVQSEAKLDARRWRAIGDRLRAMAGGVPATFPFTPSGRATVTRTGEGDGRALVRIAAPDRLGLLAAVCRWFADHGVSIEAANISTVDGTAKDVFMISGDCSTDELARYLSTPERGFGRCAGFASLVRSVQDFTPLRLRWGSVSATR